MDKRILAAAAAVMLSGCSAAATYDGFEEPVQSSPAVSAVSDTYRSELIGYADEGIPDKCLETVTSDDGICTIKKMEHYYDVTIDYERTDPAGAGRAYIQAMRKIFPDYDELVEPYIYENIMMAFPALKDDYTPVEARVTALAASLRDDSREELYAIAEEMSGGEHGFVQDGRISYEESLAAHLVPEALRGTACSALSLWGQKTESGDMIAARFLDWNLGSDYQMCALHTVLHAKKGERSFTGIGFLGLGSLISGINDDGVFGAILDLGSGSTPYEYENKRCYTYELRYALEEFDTAKEVGQYMVENSGDFTWSHHIYLADGRKTYCAEDATAALQASGEGYSVLRDSSTPLMSSIHWDSPDSLCVVNAFASEGNFDLWSDGANNYVRFSKYNDWVSSTDRFTVGSLKSILTRERVNLGVNDDEAQVNNVYNRGTSQIIIVDYHTGNIQVAFTPPTGPADEPVFTDIGHF